MTFLRKMWEHYKASKRFNNQLKALNLDVFGVYPVKITEAQIEMLLRLHTLGIRNVSVLMDDINFCKKGYK